MVKQALSKYGTHTGGLSDVNQAFMAEGHRSLFPRPASSCLLEYPDGQLASLTVLVDCREIPRDMLCGIGLDKNVGDSLTADEMGNATNCQNVDSLSLCFQLFH